MKEFSHIPVMLEECMEGLNIKGSGIYYDGTVGGGGHSYEILRRSAPDGKLIATDLDDDAISAATERLSGFGDRFKIYKRALKSSTARYSISGFRATSSIAERGGFPI